METKFSVVISVYNKEAYIASTLRSVLSQTFSDFELVILNDGSTDRSEKEVLKFKDPRIRYFSAENRGAAAGRNFVIEKAQNDYIALLDADDLWESNFLEEQAKSIAQFPNESVFATAIALETKGKTFLSAYSIPDLKDNEIRVVNYFSASLLNSVLTSSSIVVHKDVFIKTGLYNPKIKSGEDTDLWVRIGLEYKVVFKNKTCATYRYAIASLSNSNLKLSDAADFSEYKKLEKNNPPLKKFLDLNRFSLSLLAILQDNKEDFLKNYNQINLNNLSKKQRFLIRQNKSTLRFLLWIQVQLQRCGFWLTSFK